MRRHDMRQLLEAGYAACRFSSRRWIGEVDIPTAVVVTTQDRAIPPDAQLDLAASIDGATVFTIDEDHLACGYPAYANVLVEACRDVAVRIPPP